MIRRHPYAFGTLSALVSASVLAHLHVQPCPCSRCRVARNYARLLATVTDGPEPEAVETITAEGVVSLFYARALHSDVMTHA